VAGAPGCAAGGAQEQWLRSDLASHPRACQIMFMHHPMFTSDTRAYDTASFRNGLRPLWNAFNDNGGDIVLTGHSHFYERYAPMTPTGTVDQANGIQQFIVGTGGRNLQPVTASSMEPNSVVQSSAAFGVLELSLHANGYDWRFATLPGSTFTDAGSRSCH